MVSAVNSAASSATTLQQKAEAAQLKNQFLTLLLTQLKNQNPLDAVKTSEFTAQLAQYSSLEQQIDTNGKLDQLVAASTSTAVSPLSYLGTTVDYNSPTAPVQNEEATWTYSVGNATDVQISITDATGKVIYTGAGDLGAEPHSITVNSLTGVPDGTPLTFSVLAKDSTGAVVATTVSSRAKIDAVDMSSGSTILEASGYKIDSTKISRIATTNSSTNTNA